MRSDGEGRMRFLGFFTSSTVVSVFEDPIAPIGKTVVGTPLPAEGSVAARGMETPA